MEETDKKILVLYGATASGKTTLSKALAEQYPDTFHIVRSYTTRPKRPGEKEGVDYFFTDYEHFRELDRQEKLACTRTYEVYTDEVWCYGLSVDDMEDGKWNVLILDPKGLADYISDDRFWDVPPETFRCIQVYASAKVRMERCFARVKTDDEVFEFCRRMLDDEEQLDFYEDTCNYPTGKMKIISDNDTNVVDVVEKIKDWIDSEIN